MPAVPTSVYVIVSGEFVKIGIARDPAKRVKSLRTGTPEGAQVFYSRQFPDTISARYIERYCHRQLWKCRESGEWFRCSPHRARAILAKARVAPRAHLTSKGGYGYRDPSDEEAREAVARAFKHIMLFGSTN
jgi:hypothetical protein